jgi:hypothetical protein
MVFKIRVGRSYFWIFFINNRLFILNHAIQEVVEKYSDPSADDGEEVSKCHSTILFYIVSEKTRKSNSSNKRAMSDRGYVCLRQYLTEAMPNRGNV